MTLCMTMGGHCCCLKRKVKWCEPCQMWVCRVMYKGHLHMTLAERQLWRARRSLLSLFYYHLYLMREEQSA